MGVYQLGSYSARAGKSKYCTPELIRDARSYIRRVHRRMPTLSPAQRQYGEDIVLRLIGALRRPGTSPPKAFKSRSLGRKLYFSCRANVRRGLVHVQYLFKNGELLDAGLSDKHRHLCHKMPILCGCVQFWRAQSPMLQCEAQEIETMR